MIKRLALSTLILVSSPVIGQSVTGAGRAIDGDSLMVGQVEVRLFGIDAPELNQSCTRSSQAWACGVTAKDQLSSLIGGQQISCAPVGKDRHGRTVARCRAGSTNLNQTMVARGYAVAYRRYAMDYVSAEESAKAYKRGIWAGPFELPSDIRSASYEHVVPTTPVAQSREPDRPVVSTFRGKPQPSGNCRIKGNHSRKGERIYHLPGMPYYAETVAERIFCTETQARQAGFRRSRADQHR